MIELHYSGHTYNEQPVDLADLGAGGHLALEDPLISQGGEFKLEILFTGTETVNKKFKITSLKKIQSD